MGAVIFFLIFCILQIIQIVLLVKFNLYVRKVLFPIQNKNLDNNTSKFTKQTISPEHELSLPDLQVLLNAVQKGDLNE